MSHTNQTTLETYQDNFDTYVSGTPCDVSGTQKTWIEGTLSRINKETPTLEIGAAFGRDAMFMKNAGYTNIKVTDAFKAAVETLKARGFTDARKLNVLTDEPEGEYGLIFASAVFLHFNEREFETALERLRSHIGLNGLLAFTVKQGDGEEWSEAKMGAPRYFKYWQEVPLRETVVKCGYRLIELINNEEYSQKWLAVTCTPDEL